MAKIWVGTSGWVYKQWAGNFYPKGWPKKDEFGYYTRHFPTVEINATFYRLPSLAMVRGWHDKAPDGFVFAVKGSRYLTHIRQLRDTSKGLQKYFRRLVPLANRTGPILWQLPPSFAKDAETFERLERFLGKLPKTYQHAIEFRHPSWIDQQTVDLLQRYRAAHVWISSQRMPFDTTITAGFVYLRFHGLEGGAYHDYTDKELEPWAQALESAAERGLPAYVYFNNDLNTRAPLNAEALMRRLGPHAVLAKSPAAGAGIGHIAPPTSRDESWPSWKRARAPRRRDKSRSATRVQRKSKAASRRTPQRKSTQPGRTRRSVPSLG